jgi:ABC-type multidrug transport system ATPase subunit
MTAPIAHALVHLFALFASGRSAKEVFEGRREAGRYLSRKLTKGEVDKWLREFDHAVAGYNSLVLPGDVGQAKHHAKLSVKLLRTCNALIHEFDQVERLIMVARLTEFTFNSGGHTEQVDFLGAAAATLHIPEADLYALKSLVELGSSEEIASLDRGFGVADSAGKTRLVGIRTDQEHLFFLKHFESTELQLNDMVWAAGVISPLVPGSVVRLQNGEARYFSEIVRSTLPEGEVAPLHFSVHNLEHYFRYPHEQALHPLSFEAREGMLVGIMGGSGSGKSTLLSLLNGMIAPTRGRVELNGKDVHAGLPEVLGCIGSIAQEDALISELSVRENLLYSAELSMGKGPETTALVETTLKRLGLWDIRDLRVGSVLDKTISGGQRKRLNCALELIREPRVLFADEPTSGLSSRDSEHIMDLLKEQATRGRLVFAVIHQPSSDIFKRFDRMLILDQGGYPVFWGNPLDAVTHFRNKAHHLEAGMASCSDCGNVNPEHIFHVLEACTVDEFGNTTGKRRIAPETWYGWLPQTEEIAGPEEIQALEETVRTPSAWSQWKTYFVRDAHAKSKNLQYLLISLLEAPALAAFLAGFTRFRDPSEDYTFRTSENLPQFLFIAVIVSLFIGLSVSAEEILRDRPLLRRERFMRLKWGAYLGSKVAFLFGLSALQAGLFSWISAEILVIEAGRFMVFGVLFSLSCFANALGLLLSVSFNSAKVVYIVLPLLIIPQIIFGGAIVHFDRFNPRLTYADRVPWIGNIMASRWGFEALAVHLYRESPYKQPFLAVEDRIEKAAWRRDFWIDEMSRHGDAPWFGEELRQAEAELAAWGVKLPPGSSTWVASLGPEPGRIEAQLAPFKEAYGDAWRAAFRQRDTLRNALGEKELADRAARTHNEALESWVIQNDRMRRAVATEEGIAMQVAFVHQQPVTTPAWKAPFYAPAKRLAGTPWRTPGFNLAVLWTMTAMLIGGVYAGAGRAPWTALTWPRAGKAAR